MNGISIHVSYDVTRRQARLIRLAPKKVEGKGRIVV